MVTDAQFEQLEDIRLRDQLFRGFGIFKKCLLYLTLFDAHIAADPAALLFGRESAEMCVSFDPGVENELPGYAARRLLSAVAPEVASSSIEVFHQISANGFITHSDWATALRKVPDAQEYHLAM